MKQNQSFFKETGTKRDRLALLRGLAITTALAAALVFSFAACGNDNGGGDGNKDIAGTLIITTEAGLNGNAVTTATTNTLLYALYTRVASDPPSSIVTYQWKKDGTDISGETGETYKPSAVGSYTVTISAAGYNSKTSAAVAVSESDKS
ncbi:MAG: hypothetical protein MdMp014T_1695 [Treponematales bacterium]